MEKSSLFKDATVRKKSGEIESFQYAKIRKAIRNAFLDANIPIGESKEILNDAIKNITETLIKRPQISTKEIRNIILASLSKKQKPAADAWKAFDLKNKGSC